MEVKLNSFYCIQMFAIDLIVLTICRNKDKDLLKQIQISTVDAFQGAERDVIILSCVRTRSVGFIDCDK